MPIKMVREPSETPNINNIDDIIPMRYAYGGQNGYVKRKGTEIGHTISGLDFIIGAGRLVLQGVECDIDAVGVTKTIDNIATKQYYTIYLKVNLAMNQTTIEMLSSTNDYPKIEVGDDLTQNNLGIANMELYHFTATNGIIAEVVKLVKEIKYTKQVKIDNALNCDNAIKKASGDYDGFVEDENKILKTNEYTISKKRLIFEGTMEKQQTYDLLHEIPLNAKVEFQVMLSDENGSMDNSSINSEKREIVEGSDGNFKTENDSIIDTHTVNQSNNILFEIFIKRFSLYFYKNLSNTSLKSFKFIGNILKHTIEYSNGKVDNVFFNFLISKNAKIKLYEVIE